uniref:Uncharacterized protein n=1 Tax=Panagrolaimus sp. ES5 TaxID=591445 RepID=A0AC34FUC2_9BILA
MVAEFDDDDDDEEENDTKKQIQDIVIKYGKNYILPKELWDYCHNNTISGYIFDFGNPNHCNKYDQITSEAASFFYYSTQKEKMRQTESKKRFLKFFEEMHFGFGYYKVTEKDFSYPHSHLRACFEYFESHSTSVPSKKTLKQYLKMKELYSKIKAAEYDAEKWINLLAETNDHEFIQDNVELRIGEYLLDKSLWKLYINYHKKNGLIEKMLGIFSRYVRFFMDDVEMKEEYKIELEKYGKPVGLKWKNLFDFEVGAIENGENVKPNLNKCQDKAEAMEVENIVNNDEIKPLNPNLCQNAFKNSAVQNLDFKQTFINYILENTSPSILKKLHHSCKYFYAKKNTPFCYLLKATCGSTNFKAESLSLKYKEKRETFLSKTFIFGSIIAKTDGFHFIPSDFISSCIPFLFQCTAKHIRLENQNLSFKELIFLIGSGNTVQFTMTSGKIIDENGKFVDLEKILEMLPNIETLS